MISKQKQMLLVKNQQGVALFVSLIMLLILTIVGLSAAQRSNLQERMAANTHLNHVVYNAAESGIGGFLVEANSGNKLDPQHMLYGIRVNGALNDQCFNENGDLVACDTDPYLDGDRAGMITSEIDVTVVDPCNMTMCGGFSLGGASGGIGCRVFQIDATGTAANAEANHSLWAYEVTVCSK